MPFVNVRTARGLLNAQQKRQLQQELTEVLVRIEGNSDPRFRQFVTVLVEEHDPACWSVAGNDVNSLMEELT